MGSELAVGDILEVVCPNGVAYVAYAGKNEALGDAIWVTPFAYAEATDDWKKIFAREGYFAFYPAHAALRRKLVKKVGYSTEAIRALPDARRSSACPFAEGPVSSWVITKGKTRINRRDEDLEEGERLIPIATVWNHPFLVDAICRGWTPD